MPSLEDRCEAITRRGDRCSRWWCWTNEGGEDQPPRHYCTQHMLAAWREESGESDLTVDDLESYYDSVDWPPEGDDSWMEDAFNALDLTEMGYYQSHPEANFRE